MPGTDAGRRKKGSGSMAKECTIKYSYEASVLIGYYTCGACGEDIAAGDQATFCPHCGDKISEKEEATTLTKGK